MQDIRAEIAVIRSQINKLRREGASLAVNVNPSEDDSPQAIAEAYRRQARENPQLFAELKGIDEAIAALEFQLEEKETLVTYLRSPSGERKLLRNSSRKI